MKFLALLSSVVSGFLSLILGVLSYQRSQFPYNSEGRFFDAVAGVAYENDAYVGYLVVTFVLVAIFCLSLLVLCFGLKVLYWLFVPGYSFFWFSRQKFVDDPLEDSFDLYTGFFRSKEACLVGCVLVELVKLFCVSFFVSLWF